MIFVITAHVKKKRLWKAFYVKKLATKLVIPIPGRETIYQWHYTNILIARYHQDIHDLCCTNTLLCHPFKLWKTSNIFSCYNVSVFSDNKRWIPFPNAAKKLSPYIHWSESVHIIGKKWKKNTTPSEQLQNPIAKSWKLRSNWCRYWHMHLDKLNTNSGAQLAL